MEELRKLVQLIETKGSKEIQLLEVKSNKNKEFKLYNGILSGAIITDNDAIKYLYGEKVSTAGYKMLKSRLRKKLMNQLFFLNLSGTSFEMSLANELECYAKLYQAKAFINSGEYELSIPLLRQIIQTALKYGYNDLNEICNRILLKVYARVDDKVNFYKTKQIIEEKHQALIADYNSEYDYLEAKVDMSRSVTTRKAYMNIMPEKVRILEQRWIENRTFNTYYYYYLLLNWYNELQGNWNEIIKLASSSEETLEKYNLSTDRFDLRFNRFIVVYAHLRTKKYDEGLRLANLYEPYFSPETNNWFAHMENYFLLALHSKKYDLAHTLLQKVQSNPVFKNIKKLAQERWAIFEAYLHIVSPSDLQSFKFQSLVQNLPSYSKDKEGFNVAILILQVMYYLQKYDVDALAYRTEALKKYALKHFKDDFSNRSRFFFKLLSVMVQSNFDPYISDRKGKNIFLKLIQTPPPSEGYAEIEIIPYEHLWELILQRLYQLNSAK